MSEAPLSIVSGPLLSNDNSSSTRNPQNGSTNPPINLAAGRNKDKGWLMVGLVFVANFLVFGFFKSLGMLTKILNKEFDSTMNVYVLMCITYSLNCIAGPLSCYLTRRYSARAIALVGTSMVTFGLVLSWLARSLLFLYFSMGIFTGIGSGLTYPTGVILVSNYFIGTKNAAIANALVVSGSPIGGMIMPFVISYLSELYTSRGAFLIIGGLMFNAILCVRAFKPPAAPVLAAELNSPDDFDSQNNADCKNLEKESSNIYDDENNVKDAKVYSCSTGMINVTAKQERLCRECGTTSSVGTVGKYRPTCGPTPPPSPLTLEGPDNGNNNNQSIEQLPQSHKSMQGLSCRRNGATNIMLSSGHQTVATPAAVGSQPYILALDHSCIILCPSTTDFVIKQKPAHFTSNSVKSVTIPPAEAGGGDTDNTNANNATCDHRKWTFNFISPLANPIYVFLLLSNTTSAISTANIYLMVSQLVKDDSDTDYTKTSLVYLLFSSADLSGRIWGAFLCDKRIVTPAAVYAVGLVSAGLSSSVLGILPTYLYLCLGTFVYGLASGLHVGIFGLLLANIVGIQKIHAGYGIVMFINGTIQCLAILLSGRVISKYRSCFTWLAPTFGVILASGGILWICGYFLFGRKKKKSKEHEVETTHLDKNGRVVNVQCNDLVEDTASKTNKDNGR